LVLIKPLANIHKVGDPEHGYPPVVYKIVTVLEMVHITWWETIVLFLTVIKSREQAVR